MPKKVLYKTGRLPENDVRNKNFLMKKAKGRPKDKPKKIWNTSTT